MSAQEVIADAHAMHAMRYDEYAVSDDEMFQCLCGQAFAWSVDSDSDDVDRAHAAHVAAEIVKALGGLALETVLLNEYAAANGAPPQREARWVSEWKPVQP